MARMAIIFGVVLALIGVAYWWVSGHIHPTALIATWFGLVLAVCGLLASTPDAGRRAVWMHAAVSVGLIGFLLPLVRVVIALSHGKTLGYLAVQEQAVMAALCLLFTVLCVRSFIAARRTRLA